MKKCFAVFSALVVLLSPSIGFSWTQRNPNSVDQCATHAPYGISDSTVAVTLICRQAYLAAYDPVAKIPEYVQWTLAPVAALGCVARTNAFVADASISNGPVPDDYAGTGYDKGHMAPDGDQSWNQQVEYESFLMTNMTPQAPSLNRGIWKLLETSVRGWTVQYDRPFTSISGAMYNATDKKIGTGVVVPHAFYKIVIDNQTGMVAGWLFPHTAPYPNLGTDLTKFRVNISDIEKQAGVKIHLPANAQEVPVGKEWTVDFGKLTAAKKMKCGKGAVAEDME